LEIICTNPVDKYRLQEKRIGRRNCDIASQLDARISQMLSYNKLSCGKKESKLPLYQIHDSDHLNFISTSLYVLAKPVEAQITNHYQVKSSDPSK
jgi:hypothetical protein